MLETPTQEAPRSAAEKQALLVDWIVDLAKDEATEKHFARAIIPMVDSFTRIHGAIEASVSRLIVLLTAILRYEDALLEQGKDSRATFGIAARHIYAEQLSQREKAALQDELTKDKYRQLREARKQTNGMGIAIDRKPDAVFEQVIERIYKKLNTKTPH
jgi:hypothetical protein